MKFGEWLQQELDKRSWSQGELSERIGVTQSYLSMIVSSSRKASPDLCIKIADAYGISREEVFRARGWLSLRSEKGEVSLSAETALVASEIDQLPPQIRRAVLRAAQATARALSEELQVPAMASTPI